ncbi:MAG: hypothetical protein LAP13_16415 [Acidobacteriia bacterium]|nr:hypothetical protein [Terriglobia bacterium]
MTTESKQRGKGAELSITISSPRSALTRVHLRWSGAMEDDLRFLGDHWERSYGDLEWRGYVGERIMPWYFLASRRDAIYGFGVKTGASAFCFWQADPRGYSLWLDVRNGGGGLELGERRLSAATVVALAGHPGATPFQTAQELCHALCDHPRLPKAPVLGSNDWYYLYGENMTAEGILRDADLLAEISPVKPVAPFMVIDMGWSKAPEGAGPWKGDNLLFPDMPRLAAEIKKRGARPGIWVRPLLSAETLPQAWRLPLNRPEGPYKAPLQVIDPSVPEALAHIQEGLREVVGWGFELVKHDFSTYDILGHWGHQMGADLTSPGWHFADRSKTTAEVILQFYRAIREAVGDATLIGCNTVGHLGAGLFEVQRIGDDVSGRDWNRTRRMGVNALAFRLPQHGAFFCADPDCVPITRDVPWKMTQQWLDLVVRTGTALFISPDPSSVTAEEKKALKAALAAASRAPANPQPLDWTETTAPKRWLLGGDVTNFEWFGEEGAYPLSR